MRHYVLTRSAFGPAWDIGANRRRLAITRAVTARLMAQQTCRDWTWVVLFDRRDPLLAERTAVYAEAAPALVPIVWTPPIEATLPRRHGLQARIAAADYVAPWRSVVGPADELVLTTRIDDDDGFSPDAIARYQLAATGLAERTILMLPVGIRVWRERFTDVRHERNAMQTLVTPAGDAGVVYDYGHTRAAQVAPVVMLDDRPGWIWVRHRDSISGWRIADNPITAEVRETFPIDWPALSAAWRP